MVPRYTHAVAGDVNIADIACCYAPSLMCDETRTNALKRPLCVRVAQAQQLYQDDVTGFCREWGGRATPKPSRARTESEYGAPDYCCCIALPLLVYACDSSRAAITLCPSTAATGARYGSRCSLDDRLQNSLWTNMHFLLLLLLHDSSIPELQ